MERKVAKRGKVISLGKHSSFHGKNFRVNEREQIYSLWFSEHFFSCESFLGIQESKHRGFLVSKSGLENQGPVVQSRIKLI